MLTMLQSARIFTTSLVIGKARCILPILEEQTRSYFRWNPNHYKFPNPPGGHGGRHPRKGLTRQRPAPMRQYVYKPLLPEDGKYTVDPIPTHRLGGRDPETGRKIVYRGGGLKRTYYMIDHVRKPNSDGTPYEERVLKIFKSDCHTSFLALVGNGLNLRNLYATANMTPGMIIRSHGDIPKIPVRPKDGDSHPLGALPVGTQVCQIEPGPYKGSRYCLAAGTSGKVVSRGGGRVVLELARKTRMSFAETCIAVVGQNSNVNQRDFRFSSPNEKRWAGYTPRSGWWHRKDGYCGRKVKKPKPILMIDPNYKIAEQEIVEITVDLLGNGDEWLNGKTVIQ